VACTCSAVPVDVGGSAVAVSVTVPPWAVKLPVSGPFPSVITVMVPISDADLLGIVKVVKLGGGCGCE
jgi:hypothetical protein